MRLSLLLLAAVSWVEAADGARELTSADDVRARREATRNRHEESKPKESTSSTSTSTSTSTSKSTAVTSSSSTPIAVTDGSTNADQPVKPASPGPFIKPLPEGATLPHVVVSVERGWYGVAIDNGTQASASGGSLGTDFQVGYEIEPFAMTRVSGTGRVDQWGVLAGYASDPLAREAGELLSLALQYYPVGDGGWWQASLSWARLRGIATTADAGGNRLEEQVDTHWRTIAIERRYYPLLVWGLQYEELEMPSNYSLDDPDGQVVALFDDSTHWRTVSFVLGIDNANAVLVERRTGIRPLYEGRIGLGLGQLSYDKGSVERLASSYGYAYDDSGGLVFSAQGEAALGVRGALAWRGAMIELAVGGRARVAWIGTGGNSTPEGQQPDYDTLVLNSNLTTWMYGVFIRLGAAF